MFISKKSWPHPEEYSSFNSAIFSGRSVLFYLLLFLFLGSGAAALIYEIVWFQLLELVIGSSAFSLAILLATYMGGMFLGSLLLPSFLPRSSHPLRLYALLEVGIGLIGILILAFLPMVMKIYVAVIGYGLPLFLLRSALSAALLLLPTIFMGATLPIVSRLMTGTPAGLSLVGWLYGVNTAGAVLGTTGAGFYLLRVYDITVATIAAVSLNFALALLALGISFLKFSKLNQKEEILTQSDFASMRANSPSAEIYLKGNPGEKNLNYRNESLKSKNSYFNEQNSNFSFSLVASKKAKSDIKNQDLKLQQLIIYLIIALSGLSALGAEVVWTRLLSLSLGGTVYTFSLLLAVFLAGLAAGSAVASRIIRKQIISPRLALGLAQLGLIPTIIWAAMAITKIIPNWPLPETIGPGQTFFLDSLRCLFSLLPASFFWGASFPLALAATGRRKEETGKLVGKIYAANTAGAIVGSMLFSLVFMPRWGSSVCQKLFLLIHFLTFFLALFPYLEKGFFAVLNRIRLIRNLALKIWSILCYGLKKDEIYFSSKTRPTSGLMIRFGGSIFLIALYFLLGWLAWQALPSTPWQLIAYGWKAAEKKERGKPLYIVEGINSSVAVTDWNGTIVFHTGGRAEASTAPPDLRMQRMLAHLPALIHPAPRRVLVVGCGAGITAGTFLLYPEVEKIIICEIEPAVSKKVVSFFEKENYGLANDPRVEFIIEDARHYWLTSKEKYDIISSDPVHPWLKGSALLYTQEYFQMIKDHLNPGGLFTQWVPIYECDEATVKSMLATFFSIFPDGLIWSNDVLGFDYDFVLLGQKEKLPIKIDELEKRLEDEAYQKVGRSLAEIGFSSGIELLATYIGRGPDLSSWLESGQINRDRNLRLQYLAGWGLHSRERASLIEILWSRFLFPEDLFIGSEARVSDLKKALTGN